MICRFIFKDGGEGEQIGSNSRLFIGSLCEKSNFNGTLCGFRRDRTFEFNRVDEVVKMYIFVVDLILLVEFDEVSHFYR